MPVGKSYSGKSMQGESGSKPAMVGSKKGAYAHSANTMGEAMSPNVQGWNSYDDNRNQRGGSIGATRKSNGSDGGDY